MLFRSVVNIRELSCAFVCLSVQEQRKLDMKRIWSEESEESLEEYYKKKYASTPTIGWVLPYTHNVLPTCT